MNAVDEPLPLRNWTQSVEEEVANGISHGIGLVGAMIGTPILLLAAFHHGNIPFLVGTIIFTTTMLLVYLASTLYHSWPITHTKSLLQLLDHSAIFLSLVASLTRLARYFSRTSGCVMAISAGTCSCLPAPAVILRRCLFAQPESSAHSWTSVLARRINWYAARRAQRSNKRENPRR